MGTKRRPSGQKRAAKVAARKRKLADRAPGPAARGIETHPGPDTYDDGTAGLEEMRLTLAQVRADRELGSAAEGSDEWAAAVERHLEEIEAADLDESDCMYGIVAGRLFRTVGDTLAAASPAPAREEIRIFEASDGDVAVSGQAPPAQAMAFAVLLGWLSNRGPRPIPTTARERVPQWVRQTLGEGPADAVDRVVGILGTDDERQAALAKPADELGGDFLPALVWMAAGLVAVYGGGDAASWLGPPEQ
ncbi:MAG: hypothetical protein JWP64_5833 [Pseudonocardia sp.]|uniref:hypothetical protein n=1 Tax=Pseudonocardia sp. TaxID=60912 RepID=UPI00260E7103|nr:hypothetical protein [Pseudonocardia sp.]MCU1630884.1 hypothetical protein [Pseudonocardia sp.]